MIEFKMKITKISVDQNLKIKLESFNIWKKGSYFMRMVELIYNYKYKESEEQ